MPDSRSNACSEKIPVNNLLESEVFLSSHSDHNNLFPLNQLTFLILLDQIAA
jgi:hypothetical protein